MATRGRKPRPAKLKVLRGEREDRIARELETVVMSFPAPNSLDDTARKEWERIVPILQEDGILGRVDSAALAIYCTSFSRWIEAERMLKIDGLLADTALGSAKAHPLIQVSKDASNQMLRVLVEFGATPSARSRINAVREEKEDEFTSFMRRRNEA